MKSIHVRFDDKIYDEIKKNADSLGLSLNGYITKKLSTSDTKNDIADTHLATKIQEENLLHNQQLSKEINQKLCDILLSLNHLKSTASDIVFTLDSTNPNLESTITNLSFSITESKKEIIKSLSKIQDSLSNLKL